MINFIYIFFFPNPFWIQENLLVAGNLCHLGGKSSTWGLSASTVPVLNTSQKRHIRDAHLSNIPLTNSLPFCDNHCKGTDLFPHPFLLQILRTESFNWQEISVAWLTSTRFTFIIKKHSHSWHRMAVSPPLQQLWTLIYPQSLSDYCSGYQSSGKNSLYCRKRWQSRALGGHLRLG